MIILVINTGSSSLKYKLFDMNGNAELAGGMVDRIGEAGSRIIHTVFSRKGENTVQVKKPIENLVQGMQDVVALMTDIETGVIDTIEKIDAIGHRIVQGGETLSCAERISDEIKAIIRENIVLAPLHNPSNLAGIETAEKIFPGKPNIAVFDTNFHQSMAPEAFLYALPYEWYEQYQVRKYGFHGTSHKYVAKNASRLMGKSMDQLNLITLHLGNGCSACAVEKGRCKDTSMGMTPLAGMMMGTRSGDIDPAIIGHLHDQSGMDVSHLTRQLNKMSGLKGICGLNDIRDIQSQVKKGNEKAILAVDMFTYRIKLQIGAYFAALGTVDAVIFTAGIGENSPLIRSRVCENLSALGIDVDPDKNSRKSSKPFPIHAGHSRVQVWVVQTNEELQIATEAVQCLKEDGCR